MPPLDREDRVMDLSALRARLKPPGPVIDVHVHPHFVRGGDNRHRAAADYLIANADRAGITRMVLSSLGPISNRSPDPAAIRLANDDGLRIRDAAPDRFVSFCYVNPAQPD